VSYQAPFPPDLTRTPSRVLSHHPPSQQQVWSLLRQRQLSSIIADGLGRMGGPLLAEPLAPVLPPSRTSPTRRLSTSCVEIGRYTYQRDVITPCYPSYTLMDSYSASYYSNRNRALHIMHTMTPRFLSRFYSRTKPRIPRL
jgi:hypothetical protein